MSLILTPNQVAQHKSLHIANVDLKKSLSNYEDNGKSFLAMGAFKCEKTPIKIVLKGELTTDGITCAEFNKIPSYSFGLRLENNDDLDAFEMLSEKITEFISDSNTDDDWELTRFVKDDKLYIKLKLIDRKRFGVLSNIKLDPKKLGDSGLYRGQRVSVFGELGVYFNLPDKKAGITFAARKLAFEKEENEN
jgi:hypothetical protein